MPVESGAGESYLLNYPVWQLGFPGGLLIAVVAILHVLVSHFAIGGGAYLVVTEARAHRSGDSGMLAYVRRHSNFFALLTLVFGAVSGVGIWFSIGLVSPEGTSSLIHTFVWFWAIEWVFFFAEIAAAIVYAKSWDTLSPRAHMTVGWIYFVAAWMSLFVINGIVTYMLTPGRWLETRNVWDGFFNPTYFPSLFARTAMSILLAGVFGFVTLGREYSATRDRLARWAGYWVLGGAIVLPFTMWWYMAALPGFSKAYLSGQFKAITHGIRGGIGFAVLIVLVTLVCAIWKPRWMRAPAIAAILVFALGTMGAAEYMREFVRKPWVVNGFIYANDTRPATLEQVRADGLLKSAKFLTVEDPNSMEYGREVFVLQCGSCHTVDGYRGIRSRVRGWDAEFAANMAAHLEVTRGTMPPFAGDEQDRAALGRYLASLNSPVQHTVTEQNKTEVGQQVFQTRCGSCHTVNGAFRPLRGAFQGSQPEQVQEILPMLDSMSTNMPKFTGTDDEAKALSSYISTEANRPISAVEEVQMKRMGGIK